MNVQLFGNKPQEFFAWWISELSGILPSAKSKAGKSSQRGLTIQLEQKTCHLQWEGGSKIENLAKKFTADLALDKYNNAIEQDKKLSVDVCNIQLTNKKILRRSITLPQSTEENLENVIAYEMDRYTPFKKDDVYFDVKVQDRDVKEKKITVLLSVVKKAVLDEVLQFVSAANMSVQNVFSIDEDEQGQVEYFSFLKGHQHSNDQRKPSVFNKYLLVATLLLMLVALVLPLAKNYWFAQQYSNQLVAMEDEIKQARQAQSRYKTLKQDVEFLSKQTQDSVRVLDLLNELTKVVPDHTTLSRFNLEEGSVRIRGLSASASKLISIIDSSESFSGVQFVAPVTQNSKTGKESFTIEFQSHAEQ